MAWSVLQSANGTSADASSITATYSTANLSAGSKVIAYATSSNAASSPAISSVTATGSNTLTQIGSASQGNARAYIYAVDSSGSGGTTMVGTKPTITATWASGGGLSLVIQEVSGLLAGNTTAMADGTAAALTGTAASTGSPTYSTSAANEYLVAVYGDNGNSATVSIAGGWTADAHNQNSSGFSNCMVQYKNSTGGSETNGYTGADGSGWAIVEVAFKLAASAATPAPVSLVAVNRPALIVSSAGWRGAGHSR